MLMIAAWVLAAALVAPAQEREGKPLVVATLLADTEAVVPGKAFEVGVLLEMAPGWHTYWEYSGDAGLPTRVEWELPTGFVAGPLKWPAPEAKIESGEILTYAYTDKVLLLATITPPAQLAGEIELKAKVSWLVCEDICIPGDAAVSLSLPVGRQAIPANDAVFEEFRAQVPSTDPVPFHLNWMRSGKCCIYNSREYLREPGSNYSPCHLKTRSWDILKMLEQMGWRFQSKGHSAGCW